MVVNMGAFNMNYTEENTLIEVEITHLQNAAKFLDERHQKQVNIKWLTFAIQRSADPEERDSVSFCA